MILDQLIRELEFIYGGDITADTSFTDDLNADSLEMMELMSDMEDRFNINTDDFDHKPETVGELAQMIEAMKGAEE